MTNGITRWIGIRLSATTVAAALLVAPTLASAQQADQGQVRKAVVDQYSIDRLCTLTRAEIVKLTAITVSVEDAEAAIVYALSQANAARQVVSPALLCAGAGVTNANVRQAIENVRRAYSSSGTAAIQRSAGGGGGVSLFSPPAVGIGGGGSNYTQR